MEMTIVAGAENNIVNVRRWESELLWLIPVSILSLLIWLALIVSVVGLLYIVLFVAFFFVSHIAFIAHVRGSAVKIGPEQFPDLHQRIDELSRRVGLKKVPAAYLMQGGGVINALATKLFRSNFIVLFSDLLEACGDNTAARDMIIGHELGHIRAGHLRYIWFLLPGMFFPFIGNAYSRAREYTCDRYGAVLCNDKKGMLLGLAILSAGGKYAPQMNLTAFADQRRDMNFGFMTIGRWLSTHPPLSDRILALEPSLAPGGPQSLWSGRIKALAIIISLFVGIGFLSVTFATKISEFSMDYQKKAKAAQSRGENSKPRLNQAEPGKQESFKGFRPGIGK